MFKRRDEISSEPVDTLIGKHAVFEGTLKVSGTIRVDGTLKGELNGDANVLIGESGKVTANIRGKNVVLAGEVHGNVIATGRTELTPSGRLYGDLKTHSIVIDEGAIFQGSCVTEEEAVRTKAAPAAPAPEKASA